MSIVSCHENSMYMSSHVLRIAKHYVLGELYEFKVEAQARVQLPMCAQQKPKYVHPMCTAQLFLSDCPCDTEALFCVVCTRVASNSMPYVINNLVSCGACYQ